MLGPIKGSGHFDLVRGNGISIGGSGLGLIML